jgi:hypothetical protein
VVKDPVLPDPSGTAKFVTAVLIVGSLLVAFLVGDNGTKAFDPKGKADADLAFFAGFFLAAQAVERILELLAPFVPFWKIPTEVKTPVVEAGVVVEKPRSATTDDLIAQKKSDRGFVMLAVATLLGVSASAAMGLYLPEVIGVSVPRWLDMLATGFALAGGTKGLHELIKTLQKAKAPGTTAG